MKKTTVLILGFLLVITSVNAQWWGGNKVKGNGNIVTDERKMSDYDQVDVAGPLDVELFSGSEGNVSVKAEENLLEYIITEVKGSRLVIKVKEGHSLSPSIRNSILITVPFKDIEQVALSGSGDVYTRPNNIIKVSSLKANLAGSGDVKLEVDAEEVKANVSGSGDVSLTGKATELKCSVAGSGDIHAFELKANNVEASVTGSGDIKIYCDGVLKAKVTGSGDIKYRGNPTKEESKIVGSGSVSKG